MFFDNTLFLQLMFPSKVHTIPIKKVQREIHNPAILAIVPLSAERPFLIKPMPQHNIIPNDQPKLQTNPLSILLTPALPPLVLHFYFKVLNILPILLTLPLIQPLLSS
jgi:hypothetical protein